jgi:hypothetical protein
MALTDKMQKAEKGVLRGSLDCISSDGAAKERATNVQ